MDHYASGLYLAKNGYVVSACQQENYFDEILQICRKEKVSLIIPTVSEELERFAENAKMFNKKDICVAISSPESLKIANNKYETYNFFKGKPYCPQIYNILNPQFPCIVKPYSSRGSRGIHFCEDKNTLKFALQSNQKQFNNSLIMEYLKGDEYSVYGLSDLDGKPLLSIAIKRIKARGESTVAELISDHAVCRLASRIASQIGLVGPWNVQLMGSSCYKIVEINPRIAGSASLIEASGLDYIGLVVKVFTKQPISQQELKCPKNHLYMIRYNEEIFLKQEEICNQ